MARKQVTIPLGFNTANIDIGNKNQVSGLNWEFWYAYIGDVRNTLGETNYNLGLLCKSANINKFAAFKPWRDLGGSQNGTEHNGMEITASDMEYELPNNTSGYRLDHFLGYNHSAIEPGIAAHGPVNRDFNANITHEINCRLDLAEFDFRDVDGLFAIEKVYAKTYTGADRDTFQQATSIVIEDSNAETGGVINREVYITAKVDLSGVVDYPFKVVFTIGNDALGASDINYPSIAGGEVSLIGSGIYQSPPVASLGLGSSFDPSDILTDGVAIVNTSRDIDVSFGDGSNWIDLDAGGTYDGPFDIIAKNGTDWEVTVVTDQYIEIGKIPNFRLQTTLHSDYPIAAGDTIAFRIEKST